MFNGFFNEYNLNSYLKKILIKKMFNILHGWGTYLNFSNFKI